MVYIINEKEARASQDTVLGQMGSTPGKRPNLHVPTTTDSSFYGDIIKKTGVIDFASLYMKLRNCVPFAK